MAEDQKPIEENNSESASLTTEQEVAGMATDQIDLLVVNMDKVLFEGKIKTLIAPGPYGDFAILPGHTPMFTVLKPGKISVETENGIQEVDIDGGIAKINQSRIVILVGYEERK